MKDAKEIQATVKFIKMCLKDEGYSKELITYLLSIYSLDDFISGTEMNKLEIASHFLRHAREIHQAGTSF